MVKLTSFKEFVKATEDKDNSGIKVFDFFAPWCGPCRALGRTFEDISEEYEDKGVQFFSVNIDGVLEVSDYKIVAIPTVFILRNGTLEWRESGAMTADTLCAAIDKQLNV